MAFASWLTRSIPTNYHWYKMHSMRKQLQNERWES